MNNNESKELVVTSPGELFRVATDVAGVCREIVKKTAVQIQSKKYIKCEGWNAIAAAHGCVVGIRSVEDIGEGIVAIAELKRMSDGMILATAEGYVGEDEPKWANGPRYAMRAMAQTRAASRVCRAAFAHVVVLIDEGLQTTPAEEVPDGGFPNGPSKTTFQEAKREMTATPASRFHDWRDCIVHFGKHSGKQLGELPDRTIQWFYHEWMPTKKQDTKYPPRDKELALFDALERWHQAKAKEEGVDDSVIPKPQPERESTYVTSEVEDNIPF